MPPRHVQCRSKKQQKHKMPATTATPMPPTSKPNRLIAPPLHPKKNKTTKQKPPQKHHNNQGKNDCHDAVMAANATLVDCFFSFQILARTPHRLIVFFSKNPCGSMMTKHNHGTANNATARRNMPRHDAQCHEMQECFISCCGTKK